MGKSSDSRDDGVPTLGQEYGDRLIECGCVAEYQRRAVLGDEELPSVVAEGKQSDAVLPWVDSKECTTLQVILGLKNGGANVFSHGCGAHIFSADLRLNQTDCNGISRSSDRHAA